MHVCTYRYMFISMLWDLILTGLTKELSTVDGQNLAPLSMEGFVPSRSHFNIGLCVVVSRLEGTNGPNLAPPHLIPNIESGVKGVEDNGGRTTDSC